MNGRILIVDDDPTICELTRLILELTERFDVRTETNPQCAVDVAREFRPDLILLDVSMPGKDGPSVARDFAAEPALAALPIIFLTGSADSSDAGLVLEEGQHFLPKTAGTSALMETVDRVLGIFA